MTPDDDVIRRIVGEAHNPTRCHCGHKESWHLVGPETWAGCDGEDCGCEMYQPQV